MAKLLHTRTKTNNTHNSSIRSDEGLTLETADSRSLSTRVIKPNFPVSLSHRRNTTVSLETRNL